MDQVIVAAIALVAIVLFASERLPCDLTALGVMVGLLVTGVLSPEEALSGFSNRATLTVAAVFVLSAGLTATGVMAYFGRQLVRITSRRPRLLLPALMISVAFLSAFVNNTAAVAVFLPLVLSITEKNRVSPSKYLMPLSFSAQMGGTSTLIGTSTNLLVASYLISEGMPGFSMFELAPIGIVLTGVGIGFLFLAAPRLVPARRPPVDLAETFRLRGYLSELVVASDSPLVGMSLEETRLGEEVHLRVVGIFRGQESYWSLRGFRLQLGDVLLVRGKIEDLLEAVGRRGLRLNPQHRTDASDPVDPDRVLIEAVIGPRSWLIGRTLREVDFRWRYRAIVIAVRKHGGLIRQQLGNLPLGLGDSLLLQVYRKDLRRIQNATGFITVGQAEHQPYRRRRAPVAVGIMIGVVGVAALDILPIVVSALLGVGLMVLTRCLAYEDVYRSIDWQVIFLLAGIMPLGLALEKTGLAAELAGRMVDVLGAWGPTAVLAGLYLLTVLLTSAVSNNATALLMAPIGLSAAIGLGVDPRPLLVVVTLAASACFLTPVGYQTNTMIYGPGAYRFSDYARVGLPLTILLLVLTVLLVPVFWPFHP